MGNALDQTLAVLNGLVGDYLSRSGNALATEMACYREGRPLALTREGIAAAYPSPTQRVVVLVHGIMCTEQVWQLPDGSDYGSLLARELGYTPVYVRYNSGQAIADNGAALAALLETLWGAYPEPIEELLLIGYSMGGLVVRSACHVAGLQSQHWLRQVQRAIYVGTPHLGAPAERVGRWVAKVLQRIDDPYTRLIAEIGNLRSMGIQDLGDAVLRHEDRGQAQGAGAAAESLQDVAHPVPLLPHIRHYLIAGAISDEPYLSTLFGDAVVPVKSATAGAELGSAVLPKQHIKLLPGIDHLTLPHHPDVYAQIKVWCEEPL